MRIVCPYVSIVKKYVIAVLIFARLVMRYVLIVQTFVRIAKGVNTVWIFVKIASSPFLGVNSFGKEIVSLTFK